MFSIYEAVKMLAKPCRERPVLTQELRTIRVQLLTRQHRNKTINYLRFTFNLFILSFPIFITAYLPLLILKVF